MGNEGFVPGPLLKIYNNPGGDDCILGRGDNPIYSPTFGSQEFPNSQILPLGNDPVSYVPRRNKLPYVGDKLISPEK